MSSFEKKKWGYYQVLYEDDCCKIKKLCVNCQRGISYQRHFYRDERWRIVEGSGEIIINGEKNEIKSGDSVFVERQKFHSVFNTGSQVLVIHEVQLGDITSEDDIERIDLQTV